MILPQMVRLSFFLNTALHQLTSHPVTPGPESIKDFKKKVKGRPVNFGTVMPGFYRSGYPQTEDHEYLKSLGLKTIV
jgi:hypothetical protein